MPIHMSLILFPTEKWVMFTWSRALPFMIPSTLIREQQTHRHLAKSQPVYQSSSDESWTLITVSTVNQSAPLHSLDAGNLWQNNDLWKTSMWFQHLKSIYKEGQSNRSKSTLICWGWSVYTLGWTQKAAEWNTGELYSVLLILRYRPNPNLTMKISGASLDLSATEYGITLDPTFTMLEFDGLRVLPVQTGMYNLWSADLLPSYWRKLTVMNSEDKPCSMLEDLAEKASWAS